MKVVLDTNILISALVFGGNPEQILRLGIEKRFLVVTSPILLSELADKLAKKFDYPEQKIQSVIKKLEKVFVIVQPSKTVGVLSDEPDNRVLEAAAEGQCQYIMTGDKEILELSNFKEIRILTASEFLRELGI